MARAVGRDAGVGRAVVGESGGLRRVAGAEGRSQGEFCRWGIPGGGRGCVGKKRPGLREASRADSEGAALVGLLGEGHRGGGWSAVIELEGQGPGGARCVRKDLDPEESIGEAIGGVEQADHVGGAG